MTDPILEVSNLTASYGDINVFRDVDLSVSKGGVVSVVGANGVGKTTLMKTIAGVKAPDSGCVLFRGEESTGDSAHELITRGLTYVPERHTIFPEMSVLDNLRTAMIPAVNTSDTTLDRVLELFPILDERLEQSAGNMSGGQQQMLAIAQGLVAEPELIVLDEPTLGPAPKIVDDVTELIFDISAQNVSVLLVDEKIQLSKEVADKLYLMRKNTLRYLGERGQFEKEYERILRETVS